MSLEELPIKELKRKPKPSKLSGIVVIFYVRKGGKLQLYTIERTTNNTCKISSTFQYDEEKHITGHSLPFKG